METKPRVLFYHAHFFSASETFIYQQAINPHIQGILLAKKFIDAPGLPNHAFTKIQFKRSLWDGLLSNLWMLAGQDRYYFSGAVNKMQTLIQHQQIDVIHAQFGFSAVRILPLAKALKKPMVVSFHGLDASKLVKKRSYRNALKDVFDYASAIVICNPEMKKSLPLQDSHLNKVHWVPYGIDLTHFMAPERQTAGKEKVKFLHVGRLVEKKGVPDLIRTFAELTKEFSNVHLNIVGNGPEETLCRKLVHSFKLEDKVSFLGWMSPLQVQEQMKANDIFVLNSRVARDGDSEGLPVGMLEAMAMAMPVVATVHAGIPYAIEHGKSGLLVPEADNVALLQALASLVNNYDKRNSLGMEARQKVESQFTTERMHASLREIYRKAGR